MAASAEKTRTGLEGLQLTPFEERLYIASVSTERIGRFKRNTILISVMFSALFLILAWSYPIDLVIGGVLILYSLLNFATIRRFSTILASYRNITFKVAEQLLKRTRDKTWETLMQESSNARTEKLLVQNLSLLTIFYILFIAAAFLLKMPHLNGIVAGGTVFLILLSMKLKLFAADAIIRGKKTVFEAGKAWNSPDQ